MAVYEDQNNSGESVFIILLSDVESALLGDGW